MFPIYAVASEYRVLSLAYRKALSETAPTLEEISTNQKQYGRPCTKVGGRPCVALRTPEPL